MQGRRTRVVGPLVVLAAFAVGPQSRPARGELVYFTAGGEAQIPAEIDGDLVRLIPPDGPITFHRDDFRAIVPGHWPEAEWPARRDQAATADAFERYRAAWWALEHGLTSEAAAMLRSSHDADPTLQPVARLVAMLDRLEEPARSPDLAPLHTILPGDFSTAESDLIVLLHQHDASEAAERLELLDRVLTTFYLSFSAQGFDLRTPPEKLVAVWFADEADYRSTIRKEAGEAFLTTRGYYHPTRRVTFSYDGRSRADHRRSVAGIDGRRDEIDRVERSLSTTPPGARLRLELAGERPRTLDRTGAADALDRLRRETDREALLLELERLRVDGGVAAHELVHQLVVASGLAPGYDRFPVWLHEGLAMQFEEFRGGRWAGIGPVQRHRLDAWRRLDRAPELEPILLDEGFGRGYDADRYAVAWSLVYHLRKRHPGRFVAFLDQLRNPRFDPGDRVVASFRSAIGPDLDAIRDGWIADLRTVRSVLESEAPAPGSGRGDRR